MTAQTILKYTVDLNKGLQMTPLAPMLATEDDNAHTFVISAVKDGEPQRFTGADVRGFFIRPDSVTVPVNGAVDDEGNATVTLTARCYAIAGRFQLAIRIVQGDVKSVIFCGDGSLRKVSTDAFIDEEGIIPSLDELLAQIATIEGAVNNANTAADNADEAAERAIAAAEKAENAKGDTGATPNLTIGTVETLAAGSNATATITGTAEDPVLSLGIPKGYDGEGAVLSVNGETGVVELTAADVGAAPAIEDIDHPGCYYRMVDGVKEWINPPLVLGVEYRTTERHQNKTVYCKQADLGVSTNAKVITVLPSGNRMIRHDDVCSSYPLPHINGTMDSPYTYHLMPDQSGYALKMFCGANVTGLQTYSTLYYYKA